MNENERPFLNSPGLRTLAHLDAVKNVRRELHADPELKYQEHNTARRISAWLSALGIEVTAGIGGTGIVGTLKCGSSARSVAFRADMDALPIQEQNSFGHASKKIGVMHACGHDGHVAMLLGAATDLAQRRCFDGTVHFIFQPAEEGGAGALRMIDDGLFERFKTDAVYSLHNWPDLPVGVFAVQPGAIMGASLKFRVVVKGKGGHAGRPHATIDPIPILCSTVQSLQTLVARRSDPAEPFVVSVTQIGGGEATNVIPDEVWFSGTARFANTGLRATVKEVIRDLVQQGAQAQGAYAEVAFVDGYPATVNTLEEAHISQKVMASVVGEQNIVKSMPVVLGVEDFSYMLQVKPGAYGLLGIGTPEGWPKLHQSSYDFNDDALPIGIQYWTTLARTVLNEERK
jgi:amidohydrolase